MTQAIAPPNLSNKATEDKLLWMSADLDRLPDNGNRID